MHKKELCKYVPLLTILKGRTLTRSAFKSLMECLDEKAIKFLCECVKNGISKNRVPSLPVSKKNGLLKIVFPYKKLLSKICKKTKKYGRRKKVLLQKGCGF